jgi:methionyl-tRNA synthetase
MAKRFYITTPIYYVNSVPHAGHALTSLVCDAESRFRRQMGQEVVFLTGTDENGLKVYEAAVKAGEDPIAFVDRISHNFRQGFDAINIQYDIFYRTTEDRHTKAVQALFSLLQEKGHVYRDTYRGWYDVSSETFVREADLVDGKSPDGNEVRWVEEDNYFFRLSAFGDRLLEKIEAEPQWLQPEGRKNEVVSFIRQGLRDICITRAHQGWGIPVPGDPTKVIYVWFDALINYLAASGWPDDPTWDTLWPADVHWMAKEIFTRFHATLWPAMLMAAELPLPKVVASHGWFTFGDAKMSKSKGNVIGIEDLIGHFRDVAGCSQDLAIDAVRYSLLRSMPFEGDSSFTWDEIDRHYNSDLANDLGNALNRSLTMVHKFGGGVTPGGEAEPEALEACREACERVEAAYMAHRPDLATHAALDLIRWLNKHIDTRAPWALSKSQDPSLPGVLRSLLLTLRTAEILFRPVLPAASLAIASQLGLDPLTDWSMAGKEESLPSGGSVNSPVPMFPRIDLKKAAEARGAEGEASPESSAPKPKQEKPKKEKARMEPPAQIEYADFAKVSLKVARIIEAEPLAGSEKLVKLQVQIGAENRQILAGIKKSYAPADLIGRQIIVVANLKPATLMGQESQGMLLAADDEDGSPILLQPDREAPEGTAVH